MLALVAVSMIACKDQAPQTTVENTIGDAAIESVFDQSFPEDETTTFSDDFDSLDNDLAFS
jgi:hypothetical protein